MDKKLLDILVCPATGAALELLDANRREQINSQISARSLRYADGSTVDTPLEDGLLTADGHSIYRVDNGIPVMLPNRGIVCEKTASS